MTADMYALRIAPASTVSFLENTAIILVPLVQAALLRRRPGRQELLPAGLALLGVACLTLRGGVAGVGRGELLAMTAALFYTAVILLTGLLSRRGDPLVMGVDQVGTIALLGMAASLLFETPRLPQTGREWGSILALALVCSCFGFTFQPMAQRRMPAQRAAQFCAISPLSAAVQGSVFYHEHLGPLGLIGAGLILAAILLQGGKQPERAAAPGKERSA